MPERIYTREEAVQLGATPLPSERVYTREEADQLGARRDDAPVQAFAEGAADSATLGAGNEVLKGFYQGTHAAGSPEQAAAQMKARADESPIAHGAGEVAGLFTPGPGLVGKAAKAIGGGSRLAVGGVEGGLWGLSSAINEDHMTDPKLSAEHIAAGVFGGSLAGAGINVVFGKMGDLGKSALIKAFGGRALKDTLGGLAEEAVMRSVASEKDYAKRNLENRKNEVARFALDEKLVDPAGSMKTSAANADARAQQAYQQVQSHLDVADTMGQFNPTPAADRMQTYVDGMAQNPALSAKREKLQNFINEFRDVGNPGGKQQVMIDGKPVSEYNRVTKQMEPKLMDVPAAPGTGPTTFNKAWETMRDMATTGPHGGADPDLYRMRGMLKDDIFEQVAAVDPELGDGLKLVNREHANALEFRTLAENKAAGQGYTMGDYATGAIGLHAGGLPGLVAPVAKRMLRERGGFVAASALDALAQNGTLPKIAQGFQLLMRSRLADPGFGGPFRAVLETASAKGAEDLLKTHLSLAKQDPDYLMTVGLEPEDPQTVAAHTDRAQRLAQLANSVSAASAAMDQSVGRLLGGQPGRAPSYPRRDPTMTEFAKTKAALEMLVSNSENDRNLADLAPATASLAQMATQAGATYLLGKAPKDPTAGLPPAFQRRWLPSKADIRDWFRMVDAVADPRSVLDSMRQGNVHHDQIETLQTVYPRLYKEFQDKMRERLSEWDKPLDRQRRAQVERLLGDLKDPAVTQLIQAAHQRSIPPPAPPQDGRQKIDVDKNEATQAQKLEEK